MPAQLVMWKHNNYCVSQGRTAIFQSLYSRICTHNSLQKCNIQMFVVLLLVLVVTLTHLCRSGHDCSNKMCVNDVLCMSAVFQSLLDGITALSGPAHHPPPSIDIDQHWSNLLSLSVTDLDVSCLLMPENVFYMTFFTGL